MSVVFVGCEYLGNCQCWRILNYTSVACGIKADQVKPRDQSLLKISL